MYPVALTTAQQNQLRSSAYWSRTYLAVCPNTVVFRAQVQTTPVGNSYAAIAYHNVVVGNINNIRTNMTVYVGTTANIDDAVFVGRVRAAPNATTIFINETSAAITAGMFITILNDRRVWERLQRFNPTSKQKLKDWNVAFQQLAPTIDNLQSTYVLVTSASSAQVSFAPVAQAHVPSATIASWSWQVADGTFVVGNASTQNVTVSFPVGHRWVRLTVTDSGGRSSFIDVEVYVGDPDVASWCLREVRDLRVSADLETGYRASFDVLARGDEIVLGQRLTVFTVERFAVGGGAIVSNVCFVGYAGQAQQTAEATLPTSVRRWMSVEADGFAGQIERLHQPGLSALDVSPPTDWGEIAQLDVGRAWVYALQWHTTLQNVCSVRVGGELAQYRYPDLSCEAETMLEAWRGMLAQVNAVMAWGAAGGVWAARDGRFMTLADRNALVQVATLDERDIVQAQVVDQPRLQAGQLVAGFGGYTTASGVVRVFQAKAPAEAALAGGEQQTLNSQILRHDQTVQVWRSEAGQRTADALAAQNERYEVQLRLVDSWWWLTPQANVWYGLSLSARALQQALPTARWQCVGIEHSISNETARREVIARFRAETRGGSSLTLVSLIPQIAEIENPVLPAAPDYLFAPPNPLINYPTNAPTRRSRLAITPRDVGNVLPLPPQAQPDLPEAGCRTITLLASDPNPRSSGFALVNGETYTFRVRGGGLIIPQQPGGFWRTDINYLPSNGGSTPSTIAPSLVWTAGVGWKLIPNTNYPTFVLIVRSNPTPITITRVVAFFDAPVVAPSSSRRFNFNNPATLTIQQVPFADGLQVWEWTGTQTIRRIEVVVTRPAPSDFALTRVIIDTTTAPSWAGASFVNAIPALHADAFYRDIDTAPLPWIGLGGLYINSAPALTLPPEPYSPNNEYNFTRVGAGTSIQLSYSVPNQALARPEPFFVTICGPGAGE